MGRRDKLAEQVREALGKGVPRPCTDPQIWTHIFLLVGAAVAFHRERYPTTLAALFLTALSIDYHARAERPSIGTQVEGCLAKSMFGFSFITTALQLLEAEEPARRFILKFEEWARLFLLATAAAIYMITNSNKELYDPWHSTLHVVAGALVAIT
jgi:hypothetical protein